MSPLSVFTTIGVVVSVVTFPVMWMFPLKGDGVFMSGVVGVSANVDGSVGVAGATGTKAGLPTETRPELTTGSGPPPPPTPSTPEVDEAFPPLHTTARAVTAGCTATGTTEGSSWQPETARRNSAVAKRRRELIKGP